ncbi:MAG TPA: type II secretion system F family protein [Steroidobacteraceae bacterium]|nr:type II secretion system F family protein [Steroidobacteraceae bacterium]
MLSSLLLLAAGLSCLALATLRQLRGAALWWTGLAGHRTESELASLFIFVPAGRLLGITLGLAIAAVAVALLLRAPSGICVAIAVAALAGPRLVVRWLRARWRRRLAQQLPDALGMWAGLLRAGQSTQQALSQVAQRQAAPLGDELRFVLGQLRMGVQLEEAFASLRRRADMQDLRLLSTLLATQRELGGNLAESLQRLSDLMRGRLQMEARIDSLTAQGRVQGVVVGTLPLLLLVVLYMMEREAMQVLHTTWQGWAALAAIVILELLGFVLIRRIVRIEI